MSARTHPRALRYALGVHHGRTKLRPADVTLTAIGGGHVRAVDVTITNTAATSAGVAEARKRRKYLRLRIGNDPGAFIPFGLTVDGEVGPSAAALMDDLARRIARSDHRGFTRSAARSHVRGRIGNALAAGVTKQIISFLIAAFGDNDGEAGD